MVLAIPYMVVANLVIPYMHDLRRCLSFLGSFANGCFATLFLYISHLWLFGGSLQYGVGLLANFNARRIAPTVLSNFTCLYLFIFMYKVSYVFISRLFCFVVVICFVVFDVLGVVPPFLFE